MQAESISALSPETWPFSVELLPSDAFLVGGAVRDALLKRQSDYLDLDFVLPKGAVKTARQIADRYKAGFVVLDDERKIARVVFERATVDFAKQEGLTLEADLHRRDFTINAIAYNPHTGDFIDPLHGREDLPKRVIRMISPTNLADDPLRLLRAYRQAAQLDFTLDPQTEAVIRQLASLLRRVAAERIRTEIFYLLDLSGAGSKMVAAWKDGLLRHWFPSATPERVELLAGIDSAAAGLGATWPQLAVEYALDLRENLKISSYLAIAKLVALLPYDPKDAESQLMQLKFSRAEIKGAIDVIKGWQMLQSDKQPTQWNVRSQYFLFREVGSMFPSLAAMAVSAGMPTEAIAPLIDRYLDPEDEVAHPTSLVNGKDLMAALGIPSGPQIGRILGEIQLARIEGRLSTPEEALQFATDLLQSP